jgi:hypothetical protein
MGLAHKQSAAAPAPAAGTNARTEVVFKHHSTHNIDLEHEGDYVNETQSRGGDACAQRCLL